jgi:type II secretory pathway pseudopilin PulG
VFSDSTAGKAIFAMRARKSSGFTLVEFAIVLMISGLFMAFMLQAYLVYVQQKDYYLQAANLQTIQTSMASFETPKKRFPCPSDPSLAITDPNAGFEQCGYFTGTLMPLYTGVAGSPAVCNPAGNPFPNSQAGALCIAAGARHTIGDPNASSTFMDPVFIGGIPYKTMKAGIEAFQDGCPDSSHMPAQQSGPGYPYTGGPCGGPGTMVNNSSTPSCLVIGSSPQTLTFCDVAGNGVVASGLCPAELNGNNVLICDSLATFKDVAMIDTLDPWGFQMSYAVSGLLTNASTYGQGSYGTLNIIDEQNVSLLSPPNIGTYAFISHGDDHSGAYSSGGILTFPCTSAAQGMDYFNCNNGNTYVSGIRTTTPGVGHLDDVIVYASVSLSSLWSATCVGCSDIYNMNLGGVGVGTGTASPTQELQINGNIQVQSGSCNGSMSSCMYSNQICDQLGTNCWSPQYMAGVSVTQTATSSPATTPTANTCPAGAGNIVNVVTGVALGTPICTGTAANPDPGFAVPTPGVGQNCPAGPPQQYVIGFDATGAIICGVP